MIEPVSPNELPFTAYVPFYCTTCGGLAKRPVIPLDVVAKPAKTCPRCVRMLAQRAAEEAALAERIHHQVLLETRIERR